MRYSILFLKISQVFLPFLLLDVGFCQTPDAAGHKNIWSRNALSFANYTVVDNVDSLPYNPYLANTNLNIAYYYKLNSRDSLIVYVENLFVPKGSWIKKDHVNDKVLLRHEQGHFDLSEIYARKLATAFSAFHFTTNYKQEISQVATKVLSEQNKQQKRYDEESNFGENTAAQKKWNETIQNNLRASAPIEGRKIMVATTNN